MSTLGSAGFDKSGPSVLRQVGNRVDRDRSLQQDRLVSRPTVAGPSRARHAPQFAPNGTFDLTDLARQLSPAQASAPGPAQRGAQVQARGQADWAQGFVPSVSAGPIHQPAREQSDWAQGFHPASFQGSSLAHQPASQHTISPQHVNDPPWQRPAYPPLMFQPPFPPPPQPVYMPPPATFLPPQPQTIQQPRAETAQPDHTSQIPAEPLSGSQEVLARTAETFASRLDVDSQILRDNPKLAQSQFMELVRGLGQREVVVDKSQAEGALDESVTAGPTFVERKMLGADWAGEWLGEQGSAMKPVPLPLPLEASHIGTTGEAHAQHTAWGRQFADQEAVLQSDRPATTRRKSVHFDPSVSHPASLLPVHTDEQATSADLDIDQDAFLAYNGAMRTAPAQRIGVGDMEGWSEMQKDWDEWLAQQPQDMGATARTAERYGGRYLFQADNPLVVRDGEELRRQVESPTMQGVLELEAAVQRDPTNHAAWYNLGLAQQENEQEEQAIRALSKAIELAPEYHPAYLALAVSQTNEGDHTTATAVLGEWLDRTLGGSGQRNAAGSGTAYQARARLIERLIAEARQKPEDIDPDIQVALGVLFNANAEYDKAEDCFLSALSARPADWLLWNRLGATLANSGRSSDAIGYYERALALHPHFVRALFNLGIAHLNLGQYEVAAGKIVEALRLQKADMSQAYGVGQREGKEGKGVGSEVLWNTLKGAYLHMGRNDLASLAQNRELSAGWP